MSACGPIKAKKPAELYTAPAWPSAEGVKTQSQTAEYIVNGFSAYQSCQVNLDTLKMIDTGKKK